MPPYKITIVRSPRRRSTISARVKESASNETFLEVLVPQRLPEHVVQHFLRDNHSRLMKLLERHHLHTPRRLPLEAGRQLPLLGTSITLRMISQPRRKQIRSDFSPTQKSLWLYTPSTVTEAAIRRATMLWYRAYARSYLTRRTRELSHEMGVTYKQIRIKEMRSRWGSCSSFGNLNYKWQIIMAPPEIIDYLVIHELAHRIQQNHSSAFWNIVGNFDPHYKRHRTWLRKQGSQLIV